VGGAWKSQTNTVIIPADGTYFIDLTTYFCGTGWSGNGNPGNQLYLSLFAHFCLQSDKLLVGILDKGVLKTISIETVYS
jgi:hypothetical protein